MCGRYSLGITHIRFDKRFEAKFETPVFEPSYNISPGSHIPVITNENPELIQLLKWGMKPGWFKGKTGMINVRSESIQTKTFFTNVFKTKRCLIPATGFYEWKKEGSKKIPYYFKLKDEEIFTFAGLWYLSKSEGKDAEASVAIITTEANEIMKDVHHRMPVILSEEDEMEWIDVDANLDHLGDLMAPYSSKKMLKHQVSTLVNNPKNNNKELINSL